MVPRNAEGGRGVNEDTEMLRPFESLKMIVEVLLVNLLNNNSALLFL